MQIQTDRQCIKLSLIWACMKFTKSVWGREYLKSGTNINAMSMVPLLHGTLPGLVFCSGAFVKICVHDINQAQH